MLESHQPKDGEPLPIAYMSNQHLRNYLAYELRIIEGKIAALSQANDPFTLALYGRDATANPEKTGKQVRAAIQRLYPYLAEAFLRGGFEDIRERLQGIMRREGSLAPQDVLPAPAIDLPLPPERPVTIEELVASPEYAVQPEPETAESVAA